ncbi:MAG: riboflavin synthase [bacterium]|nr:riboflavin synthase [bacterium]
MFTGIIETTAPIRLSAPRPGLGLEEELTGNIFWLDVPFASELKIGQSVACSGVCLTVVAVDDKGFAVEMMEETRQLSYLAELKKGDLVNVERAMRADGSLDGHFVQGHVDGIARITEIKDHEDESRILTLQIPLHLSKYIVQKGSICLDGISLTVISTVGDQTTVGIIPHSWRMTNLHTKQPGSKLHVEVDVLAKYVEKLMTPGSPVSSSPVLV